MNGKMPRRRTSKRDVGPLDHQLGLTVRQGQILGAALAQGYYEFPRRISLTNLSELVGVRPSTLSEILRGAERRVFETTICARTYERHRPQRSP